MVHFVNKDKQDVTLSNPRTEVIIENWPFGFQKTTAKFTIETHPKRGQRCIRQTQNRMGTGWNSPKMTTYAEKVRIMDGSDGKTYIVESVAMYGMISIMEGTMKYSAGTIHSKDPAYAEVLALIA